MSQGSRLIRFAVSAFVLCSTAICNFNGASPQPAEQTGQSRAINSDRPNQIVGARPETADLTKKYLETVLFTREEVNDWLEGRMNLYIPERYDDQMGWAPLAGRHKHGIDGSIASYTYDPSGARHMVAYRDKTCRINTYGDSFTHCDQVSDGETWQERLASHLCEPVRNFGVSGYSVYQMYLRMKQEEMRTPAKYIVLNIYSDDHRRNLYGWASIGMPDPLHQRKLQRRPTAPFVKVNPATGEFSERENPCPRPESLYNLTDLNWAYENFKDDFILKIVLAREMAKQGTPEKSYAEIMKLAQEHGLATQIDSVEVLNQTLDTLVMKSALFASMRIVEKVEEYAGTHGKKVLYLLSHTQADTAKGLKEGRRFDQEFIDFLQRKRLPYVDLLEAHKADFAQFNTGIEEYLKRYYMGHYKPLGNLFTAFSLKRQLVDILEPKPTSYEELVKVTDGHAGTPKK